MTPVWAYVRRPPTPPEAGVYTGRTLTLNLILNLNPNPNPKLAAGGTGGLFCMQRHSMCSLQEPNRSIFAVSDVISDSYE